MKEEFEEPEDRLGMTPDQWEWFKRHTRGFGEQDASGVDLSQLRANLKLTPTERFRKHQRALRNLRAIRAASERAGLRIVALQAIGVRDSDERSPGSQAPTAAP